MERLIEQELGKTAAALSVDQIPKLKYARDNKKLEAFEIIDSRKPADGLEFETPNLSANPITAAERLLKAEQNHGVQSHEYRLAYEAAFTDCRRAFMESYRKVTWEYFPPLLQSYDRKNGGYTAFGRPLIQVTRDGLRWDDQEEERLRLANEYVEEGTYSLLAGSELARTHWVLTISQCPYHALKSGGQGYGYVPEINKMMIRGVGFMSGEVTGEDFENRYTEQVGLSGRIIDEEAIHQTLAAIGAFPPDKMPDKTELQGTQILIDKTKLSGVLDFVELLDDLAGDDVFMGEWRPNEEHDYSSIRRQAKARERLLDGQADELVEYMLGLAREGVGQAWAAGQIEMKINELIHRRAESEPRIAREAFDENTAKGYEDAIQLDRQKKYKDADTLRIKTKRQAPPAAYCGAGSCGLRTANPFEQNQGELLGLTGALILDTIRRCPKGHASAILYDSKGNKACRHCKLVQKAGSKKLFKAKSDHKNLRKSGFFSF